MSSSSSSSTMAIAVAVRRSSLGVRRQNLTSTVSSDNADDAENADESEDDLEAWMGVIAWMGVMASSQHSSSLFSSFSSSSSSSSSFSTSDSSIIVSPDQPLGDCACRRGDGTSSRRTCGNGRCGEANGEVGDGDDATIPLARGL